MICRKATFTISVSAVMLPDANFLSSRCQSPSSRAQKLHFCAFLASRTPIFRPFKHKIGVFVLFWPSGPSFSGVSSTKSRFLCAFDLRNPHFRAFRAQKLHFCAFLAFETLVFWLFEHKIEVFVRFCRKVVAHLRVTLTERRYTYRARCQN